MKRAKSSMDLESPKRERVVVGLSREKHEELITLIQSKASPPTDDGCVIVSIGGRISKNAKGYIQIKVKNPDDATDKTPPNTKVQLHQLIVWNHPDKDKRAKFQQVIMDQSLEISHLCPNKNCANPEHFCAEDSFTNKTRWGCPVVIYINGQEYSCCKHNPKCIPGPDNRVDAPSYNV